MTGRKLVKKCWKWSWAVTLPVTVVFFVWAFNTWAHYYALTLRYDSSTPIGLLRSGRIQARYMLSDFENLVIPDLNPRAKRLEKIQLFMQEASIKRLDSRLPGSGRDYVEASLVYPDGKVRPVKTKYRGDFAYHWSGKKKSIRVKTRKKDLYDGMRQFNLIVPKTPDLLSNHLSYALARRMGLMAPDSRLVDLYINGKYSGVYLLVEQLGEQFLRRQRRLPGDLYVGEIVGRDKVPAIGREVFMNPGFWEKDAVNNHNPPEWNEPLVSLTRAVYEKDPQKILPLLDMDSWARFAAFITICRTTHYDVSHNWRLYFDPAKGAFEPVVWDPVGWHFSAFVPFIEKQSNRMDVITSFIFEALHTDQSFLAAKHEAVKSFFSSGGAEFLETLADDTALKGSVRRDRNIFVESVNYFSPRGALRAMATFRRSLTKSLEEVEGAYMGAPSASWSANDGKIQVNVNGFAPIEFLEAELTSPASAVTGVRAAYYRDGQRHTRDLTGHVTRHANTLRIDVPLFARREMEFPWVDAAVVVKDARIMPASYEFEFSGGAAEVKALRAGYDGGAVEELGRMDEEPPAPLDGTYSVLPAEEPRRSFSWRGEVVVDGVKEIDGDLTMAPGTRVIFTGGASLIIRGRLHAEGSKSKPILFTPAVAGQKPWGAVVLAGSKANGSVLKNCVFTGGSGLRHDFVEYSAMLSIHSVDGVLIEDSSFADNKVVDDMVHAVYSTITVRNSTFERSNADALDLDYADARIIGSRFLSSGNDSLDLMTSNVVVLDSSMEGSGDKGISVGEGSRLFVWNTTMNGNVTGVQAKDGSVAVLYNVELDGNKKTLDAYKKNWQYGDGGHLFVLKSVLRGGLDAVTADGNSRVALYDSFFKGEAGKKKKRIFIDTTVDGREGYERRAATSESLIGVFSLPEFARPYLKLIDPDVRGRTDGKT